ncbi:MAG: CotH kinase family protein [Prevotella sp.]|nr:CotH kinase family protein [Prevotella sp.]
MNSQTTPKKSYAESLFTHGEIASVEINMSDSTWKNIIEHARDKQYHVCSVAINGEQFDSVAIRTKGASSLDDVTNMKSDRYSFTLKLNKYRKGQKYHGMTKLQLNNNIWDATQMKDAVVYDMCRHIGLPAPLANYARISLNGKHFGCYLMVEAIDKHFCKRNYPDEKTNIYKPYHNLAYTGEDMKKYADISNFAKVGGDEASILRVVAALRSVDEGKDIDGHVDVESVMKYMALQTIVVNYDCMTGKNVQNYYLREADGKISLIPWDYNLAWGGYPDDEGDFEGFDDFDPEKWKTWFDSLSQEQRDSMEQVFSQQWIDMPMTESSWSKEDVSKIVNFPIDTPFTSKLTKRTFFMNLLANESYKARYYHYLNVLCNDYIKGGGFQKVVATIEQEIGSFVGKEANAFYSNERFHKAMQTFDMLLQKRATSVLGQICGSIPSTWDAQKAEPEKLINSDDINLSDLGGLMVIEKK